MDIWAGAIWAGLGCAIGVAGVLTAELIMLCRMVKRLTVWAHDTNERNRIVLKKAAERVADPEIGALIKAAKTAPSANVPAGTVWTCPKCHLTHVRPPVACVRCGEKRQ